MAQYTRIILAVLFSLIVPALGYVYLGKLYAFLFLVGYLGGFALWLLPRGPHGIHCKALIGSP